MKFIGLSSQNKAQTVWIKFDDRTVGATARSTLKNISDFYKLDSDLSPVVKVKRNFRVTKQSQLHVCREQFPFVVVEGWTIHKGQGRPLDLVVVNISKIMEIALLYVALSRATSLSGLYIIGEFNAPRPRPPTDPVIIEMN